ncbi:MAG: SGNH/GDSL hydrolase family protein [Lachnospiraceae bacterium]|nr:SGNH/GDSL hydrolase family protein [Lachnospiraceae bacterium]
MPDRPKTFEEFLEMMKKLPGNAPEYDVSTISRDENSVLKGRSIIYLGSSVTFGAASQEQSFIEFIDASEGTLSVKEAVSGTTLVDDEPGSYIERMLKLPKDIKADAFVCQLSTNDASKNKPLDKIVSSIEYIIDYAKNTWHCPVFFYTGTKFGSELYGQMVDAILKMEQEGKIKVLDLWNDPEMNAVSPKDYELYMADPIHPTKAGYLKWWTPKFIAFLKNNLA